MTGAVLGLVLGVGLLLCWSACWTRVRRPRPVPRSVLAARDELVQAGYAGRVRTVVAASVGGALVVWVVVTATTGVPVIGACFAVMAAWVPVALVRWRARRRRSRLRELWPDVVDNLASGVRAGLSLPEAVSQLGVGGPAELRPAFERFGRAYRATGQFHDALDDLKAELADPVADRVVESLRVAREVGGTDLGRLLRTLSAFLRDDARTRAELETRQGWTVNAARLAVAAPWIVLALLATRPEAVAAYDSAQGALVLVAGAVACVGAYRLMLRIARLPEEGRVLR